jgi:hypothetical protein
VLIIHLLVSEHGSAGALGSLPIGSFTVQKTWLGPDCFPLEGVLSYQIRDHDIRQVAESDASPERRSCGQSAMVSKHCKTLLFVNLLRTITQIALARGRGSSLAVRPDDAERRFDANGDFISVGGRR